MDDLITPPVAVEEEQEEELEQPQQRDSRSLLWSGFVLAAFVFGLGAGYLLWARPLGDQLAAANGELAALRQQITTNEQQAAEQQAAEGQQAGADQSVKRYDVPVDDDPILGSADAKITIIEFSDYECPYCRRWHQEVFPLIKEKYGNKVRFVYRDFPLYSIHPNAGPAANAANCAGEQDRYWEFNELVYETQGPLSNTVYEGFASQIGLNVADFKKCLDEQRYQAEVEKDYNYASELGVRSTPTFFINGLAVVGAQPFDVFERIIEMELAGEIPQ